MKVTVQDPDNSLTLSLTINPSEASALAILLERGYEWHTVGHDWGDLTDALEGFADPIPVLKLTGKAPPFKKA